MKMRDAIKAVAAFEALKGFVVLLAASGALLLIHRDMHEFAARLIEHAHLNPAAKYPHIFIDAAANVHDARLLLLAAGAAAYSILRLVEAYGLLREAAWAEMLAAASGAIYVPFEIAELVRRPSWLNVAVLVLNLVVVAVMVGALRARRRHGRR